MIHYSTRIRPIPYAYLRLRAWPTGSTVLTASGNYGWMLRAVAGSNRGPPACEAGFRRTRPFILNNLHAFREPKTPAMPGVNTNLTLTRPVGWLPKQTDGNSILKAAICSLVGRLGPAMRAAAVSLPRSARRHDQLDVAMAIWCASTSAASGTTIKVTKVRFAVAATPLSHLSQTGQFRHAYDKCLDLDVERGAIWSFAGLLTPCVNSGSTMDSSPSSRTSRMTTLLTLRATSNKMPSAPTPPS
jgi:hypothetical protein